MNKFVKIILYLFICSFLTVGVFNYVQATTCREKYLDSLGQCSANCAAAGENYQADTAAGLCSLGETCCFKTASTTGLAPSLELQIPLFDYNKAANLPEYILTIYRYAIIILVPLAIIMIIIGGIFWISAAGNTGKIGKAKKFILDSLIGLGIALFSYIFLSLIGITTVSIPGLQSIKGEEGEILSYAPSGYQMSLPSDFQPGDMACPKSGGAAAIAQITSSSVGKVTYRLGARTFSKPPYTGDAKYPETASFCPPKTMCLDCSGYTGMVLECAGITNFGGWKNGDTTNGILGCQCSNSEKITSYTDTSVNGKPLKAGDIVGFPSGCGDIGLDSGHVVIYDGNGKFFDCHGGKAGRQPGACVGNFTLTWFDKEDPSHKDAKYHCVKRLP
jgi:hypothetical protein